MAIVLKFPRLRTRFMSSFYTFIIFSIHSISVLSNSAFTNQNSVSVLLNHCGISNTVEYWTTIYYGEESEVKNETISVQFRYIQSHKLVFCTANILVTNWPQ